MIQVSYNKKMGTMLLPAATGFKEQAVELWMDRQSFQHLRCQCADFQMKQWCPHVERVYTEADLDAQHVASTTGIIMYKSPKQLVIPTLILQGSMNNSKPRVPTVGGKLSDVASVKVKAMAKDLAEVFVVYGISKVSMASGTIDAAGQVSIGFIRKGVHGRKTIRRLVFEWLAAVPYLFPEEMACDSTTHNEGECYFDCPSEDVDKIEPDERKRQSWRLRDAFNLLDTGECYVCSEAKVLDVDIF